MKKVIIEIQGNKLGDFLSMLRMISGALNNNDSNDSQEFEDNTSFWFEVRDEDGKMSAIREED